MSRPLRSRAAAVAVGLLAGCLSLVATSPAGAEGRQEGDKPAQHVLLLSVDGLHATDLARYVSAHPNSNLAGLSADGVTYRNALTPVPSDSFPGILGQVTGGNPRTTGVYYDDSYNRTLLPAGTTNCAGATPGAEVNYSEQIDNNLHALDAGQGLPGLPDSILQMTGDPRSVIDPAMLPVDPATCAPVYPHSYLKVNTTFEVVRGAGLRTAWSDKHPSYEILNGPSGAGVQDLFTPEIASDAPTIGSSVDWTKVNRLTQQYDHYKVQAVLNEIAGFDHSRTRRVGVPALFGMNFQSVSTAEKLPMSDGQRGGYLADGVTPGPVLAGALDYVDREVGSFRAELRRQGLERNTVIILSAKHGQSPQEPAALTRIPDGPIIDGLNLAWAQTHPQAKLPLVALSINDDAMLLWLNDRSPQATDFAEQYLLGHNGTGNDINGQPKAYRGSGLAQVFPGREAARYFGSAPGDQRVPDLFGVVQHGVVYTGKMAKIAEHGGADRQDRNVALVVSGPFVRDHRDDGENDGQYQRTDRGGRIVTRRVETTQIAPTTLRLLGLNPRALQAVRSEGTPTLPHLG